ncbi:actin-related protein [Chloropicon primus]|uniref:Actin-related protein n=2 Tax=Chloropicon primus TaxID=1764295 RepID=A0A5B8MDQ0_9CHLO|nr:actin-related protein [Chloropicon primus]UPQ97505.1 actin-related protein [Chloropicon primus]|eukprot:QDZ18294.1 actin-related protein [Chloropicon primus]
MGDRTAILDHGSWSIKAGHAHSPLSVESDLPLLVTPTRVRVYDVSTKGKADAVMEEAEGGGMAGGEEAEEGKGEYAELGPIQDGVICDWDSMEVLWHYILYEQLGWEKGEEETVLISERVLSSSKLQRELMTQIMFEKFNTKGVYMADQARLSLGSYGKVSGCVVDIGHGKMGVSCVVDGQLQQPSSESLLFGGEEFTQFLREAVQRRNGRQYTEKNLADLKHDCMEVCSSAQAYLSECESREEREHDLPDGTTIKVGKEFVQAGEMCFQPHRFGYKCMSLVDVIQTSISHTSIADLNMKRLLTESVLITGCGSVVKGLEQRVQTELRKLFPPSYNPSILRRPEYMPVTVPMHSAWVGGFIEAKLAFSQNQHITKYDYDEYGPSIVHRKTFL